VVICLKQGADCLRCIPKPHHLSPHLNPDWFYRSGTGSPRLSWKRGRETVVRGVCVSVMSVVWTGGGQAMSSVEQSHRAERDNSSAVQHAEMQLETERDRSADSVL